MTLCSQFGSLFKKNMILMKRNIFSSCCLFIFPIILFVGISLIRKAITSEEVEIKNQVDFVKSLTAIYPQTSEGREKFKELNLTDPMGICRNRTTYGIIKGDSIIDGKIVDEITKASFNVTMKSKVFESEEKVVEYVRDELYGISEPTLCFALGVKRVDMNSYEIILKYSSPIDDEVERDGFFIDIPSTIKVRLDPFQSTPITNMYRKWRRSGFIYMINMLNNIILQESTNNPPLITGGVIPMIYPTYEADELGRILGFLVPFFLIIIYLIPLIIFVYRMVRDKELRVKEGMRIMGMTDLAYFLSYFVQFLIINVILAILGGGILGGALQNIPFIIRFGMLFLYGLSVFGLAYIFQSVMDKSAMAIIISILVYFIFYFISPAVVENEVSRASKMGASLLSPICLSLGFITISQFEIARINMSGFNGYRYYEYSANDMMGMLFLDSLLYLFIGYYFENVIPQQYGTPRPWYFLFTKSYWIGSNSETKTIEQNYEMEESSIKENFQDEAIYQNLNEADILKIRNIHKVFGDGKKALNGVSLNLYKNEIFALLGHNGAGKSTLINILSGLYQSTKGQVLYNNQDMLKNLDTFRKKIGICPQHDVLFTDITVKEHLELFANFKGVQAKIIEKEIDTILTDLEIKNKSDELSQNLSGGQKRKLSIAIALIGGSEIVFLDEPTAGMDITSRRKLWDILKKFTNNRIIILTTHYMEEANVLGKRIGIVSSGLMKCIGTPLFLIDKFGKNISLTLMKKYQKAQDESQQDLNVISKINDIYSRNSTMKVSLENEILSEEILVRLPINTSNNKVNYKKFFEELDSNLENLKIKNYSASMPTIEDVFLLISDEIKKGQRLVEVKSNGENSETRLKQNNFADYSQENYKKPGWCQKFCSNLKMSLIKRFIQSIRNIRILILEILCPIILVLIGLGLSSVEYISDPPAVNLNIEGYLFEQKALVNRNIKSYNNLVKFEQASVEDDTILNSLIKFNSENQKKYESTKVQSKNRKFNDTTQNSNLASFYFTDYSEKNIEFFAFVNMKTNDGAPTFLQFMYENLIRDLIKNPSFKIALKNNPFPLTNYQKNRTQSRNNSNLVFFCGIAFALIPASFIIYIVREKITTKHLQVISGISFFSYWIANFLFELIKYYITGGIIILIILAFDKFESYLWLLYLLQGPAMISNTYLCSFFFNEESSAQNFIVALNFVVGALGGSIIVFLRLFESLRNIAKIISYIFRIVPVFAFCNGYSIMLNRETLFYIDNPNAKVYTEINVLEGNYIGSDIAYLVIFFLIYFILIFVIEMVSTKWACGKFKPNQPDFSYIKDEEVKNEINKANKINQEKDAENQLVDYSIVVKNIEKTYSSCCGKQNKAARNISFTLEYGDCFAMLGVNGAGKSTMFKCLTNQELPEKGEITINGKSISHKFDECRNLIGYCPQQDAIFEELTVKENLEFYSSIKGIPNEIKQNIIESLIKDMNLSEFSEKQSGNLSGGNKRKLSVAIAMIGNPPIILLDEPSAGMDPEARRFMWAVIHKITKQRKKSSVILTTHSMEEAETLCQKMGIMVRGQFQCFGSSTIIKNTYGKGYEIFLTIAPSQNISDSTEIVLPGNTSEFLKKLNSNINIQIVKKGEIGVELYDLFVRDGSVSFNRFIQWEHSISSIFRIIKELLKTFPEVEISEYWENTYQLKINKKDGVTIGFLFGLLDEIKQTCNISEYSITQTSMEQIFNSFANKDILESDESPKLGGSSNYKPPILINSQVLSSNYAS